MTVRHTKSLDCMYKVGHNILNRQPLPYSWLLRNQAVGNLFLKLVYAIHQHGERNFVVKLDYECHRAWTYSRPLCGIEQRLRNRNVSEIINLRHLGFYYRKP